MSFKPETITHDVFFIDIDLFIRSYTALFFFRSERAAEDDEEEDDEEILGSDDDEQEASSDYVKGRFNVRKAVARFSFYLLRI